MGLGAYGLLRFCLALFAASSSGAEEYSPKKIVQEASREKSGGAWLGVALGSMTKLDPLELNPLEL